MTPGPRVSQLFRGSLQKRVIVPLCISGFIAVALGAALTFITADRLLHRQMQERGRLITTTINHMAMVVHDWEELQHVVEQLSATDEVETVTVVLLSDGRIVSATDPSWVGTMASELPDSHVRTELMQAVDGEDAHTHAHATTDGRPLLYVLSPLHDPSVHDAQTGQTRPDHDHAMPAAAAGHGSHGEAAGVGKHVRGMILLVLNEQGAELTTSEILRNTILALSFVAGVTVFIAFLFLKFDVLRRIGMLKSAMLTRRLDLNREAAPALGNDEIGEIAKTYNELLRTLDHRQDRLRETSDRLSAALDEAQNLSRAKSDFVANMSHELRTPLNAVIGYSEALEQNMVGRLSDKQSEYVRIIHLSGQHLLYLINNLLEYAKIDSGKVQLNEAQVDLQLVLEEAVSMTAMAGRKSGLEISCHVLQPAPRIHADRRAIFQVVLNLLANAIKFTPSGGKVDIQVVCEDDLTITVRDSGIGIPPEQLERVFEPFFHGGGDNGRNHDGTGLGLTIVKSLVEAHGGKVKIASRVDEGTSVTITLPRERVLGEPLPA